MQRLLLNPTETGKANSNGSQTVSECIDSHLTEGDFAMITTSRGKDQKAAKM